MKPITLAILSAVALCGCKPKESTAFEVTINTNATEYFFHYSFQQFQDGGRSGEGNTVVQMTSRINDVSAIESARAWIRDNAVAADNGPTNSRVIIHWFTEIKQ